MLIKSVSVKKRAISIAAGIIILGLTGFFWYNAVHKKSSKSLPPVVVNAEKAKLQKWYTQIKATGTISSFRGIMISSEVSGRVTGITFESGTYIEEGVPLFQIYPDILNAQLEQYKAMTKLAALDYARGLKLYDKSVISRQDLDQLTSTLQQDKALISQTEAKLAQHNIDAPFDGQAGLRLVNEGDYVSPGQSLVTFQQLSPLRIEFSIPENYLSLLAKEQTVQIIPSSNPKVTETGTVYAFDSAVDPNTRAISMRAEIPNDDRKLIPGGFAEVTLFAGQEREIVTVEQTAINYSTLGTSVYVIQADQTVKSVTVTVGDRLGNDIEVLSGLKAGDYVVTGGQIKLYEGAKVKVEPLMKVKQAPDSKSQTTDTSTKTTSSTSSNTQSSDSTETKSTTTSDDTTKPITTTGGNTQATNTKNSEPNTETQDQNAQPSQE